MRSVFKINERTGTKSAEYFGKIKIAAGSQKRIRLFSDKAASERELARRQKEADQRAVGLTSDDTDRLAMPLPALVAEYFVFLATQSSNPEHLKISRWMLDRLIERGQWKCFQDITTASLTEMLSAMEKEGATASYRNKFIVRAKAFVTWALSEDMANPLSKLKRIKEKGSKRTRERRAATEEQLHALFKLKLPSSRRIAYALAAFNGFRRNEVASLTWERLHLDEAIPYVSLPQKQGSGDCQDSVPLHPYVIAVLKTHKHEAISMRVVQYVPDPSTLERDWKRAGVPFTDDRGRRIDFHGLRHTFQTLLDRTGCSRATKKRLMRHAASDVTDGYAHAELAEMVTALTRLRSPAATISALQPPRQANPTDQGSGADHSSDQLTDILGHFAAPISSLNDSRFVYCPVHSPRYNSAADKELQLAAGNDSDVSRYSLFTLNLRPDTQVD